MITVTLKEAYELINKKEVGSVSGKMKAKMLRDIEQNYGSYEITGEGRAMRISFPYSENKEVVKTRKIREDRQENMDKVLHYLCQNYWSVDFMTNEELGMELDLHPSTVSNIISEFRKIGYLVPKLEKVKTPYYNLRTQDWDSYMRDVNENTYYYKRFGIPVAVSHNVWKDYWQWQSDWIDYHYEGDLGAHADKDVKNDSRSEFKRLNGFEIVKKHTRKPKVEVMEQLGYEIPPCPFEIIEEIAFERFSIDTVEDTREVEDTTSITEPTEISVTGLNLVRGLIPLDSESNGFGRQVNIKSEVLPYDEMVALSL